MAEKKIRWTLQQKQAIMHRDGDVLVTASAGTGKTAVLSGRYVDIASDKNACPDVWSILVLTFTDLAAEQMRSRIGDQLEQAFLETGDPHLRRQFLLLQAADISTMHAFCKRLVTEHFYKLDLDPTFGIIDGDEQKLLKSEILEKTTKWAWQQNDLQQALQQLLRRRDLRITDGFLAKITAMSNFLDGVISRQRWYKQANLIAEAINPFATNLGKKQKQIVAERLQNILDQLRYCQKLYENQIPGKDRAAECENTFISPVSRCIAFLNAGEWENCAENIRNYIKPRITTPQNAPQPIAGIIQKMVKSAIDDFEKLSNFAILNPDYLDRVGVSAGLQTTVLVKLVKKFDQLYSQSKRAANCLDFADLEHYALKLLTTPDPSSNNLSPSETALSLRQKYKYIFVDEYQDINPVQQAILDSLSPGGNIFVVGDVKQSIYAFRGAKPDIFLERLKSISADQSNPANSLRVNLNANFRSAKGILDFANKIFGRIMTISLSKIDYNESAKLKPAIEDKAEEEAENDNKPIVELHILDDKKSKSAKPSEQNIYSSRQRQAAMIADRIHQMVGTDKGKPEFQIYDKQLRKMRGVEYRDIVILMRSPAKRVNDYVQILQLAAVPVSCQGLEGYFEATEISDCLCLLKVLDNPQRDIQLAGILRSPFFNVSDNELAKIKIHNKTSERHRNFYDCLLEYSTSGRDTALRDKLNSILTTINQWRSLARNGNVADLIWHIFSRTHFLSYVSALPGGRQRRSNLLKFHDRAIQFEGFASTSGIPSLTRFVEFIEKIQETGHQWQNAEPHAEAGNTVRLISIHKSKGLEFPVVFLAELNSEFSKKDRKEDCLIDDDYTLGLRIINGESNTKSDSIAYQVIEEQRKETSLAEEIRILYVAATRARERLILTASEKIKHCQSILLKGFFFGKDPIPGWQLRSCQKPLEWILYALSDDKNLHKVFETGLAEKCEDEDLFSVKLYRQSELEQLSEYIDELKKIKSADSAEAAKNSQTKQSDAKLLKKLKNSLAWQYKYEPLPFFPAKCSVTQWTHRNDINSMTGCSKPLDRKPKVILSAKINSADPDESRLIGIATHMVIAKLNLGRPITKEAIEETKEKLLTEGHITKAVISHINANSILAFFNSKPGIAALDPCNNVWREWPFSFTIPASKWQLESSPGLQFLNGLDDDIIIVQGLIDMLIHTPQGLLVIDFKTDNITAEQIPDRSLVYRQQLELYSRAAGSILNSPILGKWLYFLKPAYQFEV